jgi:hypothetical protein
LVAIWLPIAVMELRNPAGCRAKPQDNHWGIWLLEVAPSVLEIGRGKDDGATGFDFVDVDLLTLPKCLDEVESFAYDPDYGKKSPPDPGREERTSRSLYKSILSRLRKMSVARFLT